VARLARLGLLLLLLLLLKRLQGGCTQQNMHSLEGKVCCMLQLQTALCSRRWCKETATACITAAFTDMLVMLPPLLLL
jgi:hypothetical protein